MGDRGGRPLLLIDLAVPRDIDAACGDIDGVSLYDIDDLQAVVPATAGCARPRRARPRGSSRRRSSASPAGSGSLEVLPTIARAARARRPRSPSRSCARTTASGRRLRARPRAGRGGRPGDRQPAAARAHAAHAQLGDDASTPRMQLVRELFGLEDERRRPAAPRQPLAEVRELRRPSRRADADRHARERAGAGAGATRWPSVLRRRRGDRGDHHQRATAARSRGDKSRWVERAGARAAGGRDRRRRALGQGRARRAGRGLALVGGRRERADPRDVLCGARSLDALPAGARVGHEQPAPRRRSCAPRARTSRWSTLRGNVDTRLRKLADGRVRRDRARARRAGAPRPRRRGRRRARRRSCRRPARGRSRSRRAPTTPRAAGAAAIDDAHVAACLPAERALARALARAATRRSAPTPTLGATARCAARVRRAARRLGVAARRALEGESRGARARGRRERAARGRRRRAAAPGRAAAAGGRA